jgi:alkylhydroperoxidase/carboxymuconolactone decarboxylase family protein YurZ
MKTINIIVQTALCAAILGACSANKNTKDMNTLSFNEEQAAAMTAIPCHGARGDQSSLAIAIGAGLEAGLTANQIKEALSQLYAYTGFPRSLNALGT